MDRRSAPAHNLPDETRRPSVNDELACAEPRDVHAFRLSEQLVVAGEICRNKRICVTVPSENFVLSAVFTSAGMKHCV